jgi:Flp pilus assembly protein CpaB
MAMNNIFKGRWTVWILALTFALLAGFGTLFILSSAAERVNYYVVADNVAARTQITPDMVKTVSAPADAVPANSLSAEEVTSGDFFSKVELSAGTPLTDSVVTDGLNPLSNELPDGYVMASLIVSPEDAAGGRISRGDLVDIAAVDGDSGVAKIVLHQVYVLDVAVAPDTVADSANTTTDGTAGQQPGPDSAALYGGIPQMYTFAVSRSDMLKLALIRDSQVYLALTSGGDTTSVDETTDSSAVFSGGEVSPSWSTSKTGTSTANAKTAVEKFYTTTKAANAGCTFNVVNGKLIAYKTDGTMIGSVDLQGGTFDVSTGTYTAP